MKNLKLMMGYIAVSFIAGISLTLLLLFAIAKYKEKPVLSLFGNGKRDEVEIKFLKIYRSNSSDAAVFEITNNTSKTISFIGYDKLGNCGNYVLYDRKIEYGSDCWCGTGLATQSLKSGEKTTFTSNIPETKGYFAVGYNFFIGDEKDRKTFWSELVKKEDQ